MDENAENVDNDDIVIIVENEAESLPAEEERLKQQGTFGLMDTCPICKLSFHNREPKLLPCLHSFCKRCLPAPFRSSDPRRDSQGQVDNNKSLGAIRCPECRQECWEMDVLDNFFVKDSAEVPSSTVEKTTQVWHHFATPSLTPYNSLLLFARLPFNLFLIFFYLFIFCLR